MFVVIILKMILSNKSPVIQHFLLLTLIFVTNFDQLNSQSQLFVTLKIEWKSS